MQRGLTAGPRININLCLCFSVLKNLAPAAVPAPPLRTAESSNLLAGLEGVIVQLIRRLRFLLDHFCDLLSRTRKLAGIGPTGFASH